MPSHIHWFTSLQELKLQLMFIIPPSGKVNHMKMGAFFIHFIHSILTYFDHSSDMLQKVQDHTSILQQRGVYTKSAIWNMGKLVYVNFGSQRCWR